jgi:hypothetical protein
MPKQNLQIVRFSYPLSAICESCNLAFASEARGAGVAAHEVLISLHH